MSTQRLTAFEKQVIEGLAFKAGLAATLLDAWSEIPHTLVQSERSLVNLAQLGVTEERATREVLEKSVEVGLLDKVTTGFLPRTGTHNKFQRLALSLHAIEYYTSSIHVDATRTSVVLTKPAKPSTLEQKLSQRGWRTSDLEPTDSAFHSMCRSAKSRVVVMTPFLDVKGAAWLKELFSVTMPRVERILVLRSLESPTKDDYPNGYDSIAEWLGEQSIRVFNYSIPKLDGKGRETFHAKVLLCDYEIAYLGSSNITSASISHSMEMGVTVSGRAAADVAVVIEAVLDSAKEWT
jgi:phosphatidylserine/phosphatidylglycerophosphate/cardiolipin synthase-like enzyme